MPKVAVITPYYREPLEVLVQCHRSVLAQLPQADHFMVADGFPRPELAGWKARHVVLPVAHHDGGSTPRGIGAMLADSEGYDFVTFLDADNWYHPGHLASLLQVHQRTGAQVCTCFRTFHRPDGTKLEISEQDEDQLRHVDTSCFMVHRSAFSALAVWPRMPKQLGPLCDRVFLAALKKERFSIVSTRERTVAFRTLYELHYRLAGLSPPADFKPLDVLKPSMTWLLTKEGIDESYRRFGFWPPTFIL